MKRTRKLKEDASYDTEKMRKWRAANPERAQAQIDKDNAIKIERWKTDKKYKAEQQKKRAEYMARPGVRERRRKQWKEWAQANRYLEPEVSRARSLKKLYGLTPDQYDAMLAAQDGCCAICGTNKAGNGRAKYFNVDHCHDSDRVRALLCHGCNTGLGGFKDDLELLRKAAEYIERHNDNPS